MEETKNINIANYNSPLKMFDYLASGKIIISSKRDGICEILKHNYNAILIKEYSVEIWIKYLKNIKCNKYNLKKLRLIQLKLPKNLLGKKSKSNFIST